MKSYLAAAVQMTSVSDVDKNLAQAEDLIHRAPTRTKTTLEIAQKTHSLRPALDTGIQNFFKQFRHS